MERYEIMDAVIIFLRLLQNI